MFTSRSAHYPRNIHDGQTFTTSPAYLDGPNGKEPGVAIFADKVIRYVLREDHAIALANAIVDSLDKHHKR